MKLLVSGPGGRRRTKTPATPAALLAATMAATVLLAACSGDDSDTAIEQQPPVAGPAADVDDPDLVPVTGEADGADGVDGVDGDDGADGGEAAAPTTEFDLDAQPSAPPIEPVPETGVPGIDSNDAFCRAWSEFAGSYQALGLTSAVGEPDNAYRLEVVAASSLTAAVEAMEANLPAELESERSALVDDLAGPILTRARSAEAELESAGVDPDVLRDGWLTTLTAAGVDDPFIELDIAAVSAGVDAAAVEAAVGSFAAEQPAIVEDPSLVTAAQIPLTEQYLAESCPDGGTLAGNDVTSN